MFGFMSLPKYYLSRKDFRRLMYFNIFCINIDTSEWLAAQYPKEMTEEVLVILKKQNRLFKKHCLLLEYQPDIINRFLSFLHLPSITIPLKSPVDIVGYANAAFDLQYDFYKKWGDMEESKYFWPENCPEDSLLCTMPRLSFADALYKAYERAVN